MVPKPQSYQYRYCRRYMMSMVSTICLSAVILFGCADNKKSPVEESTTGKKVASDTAVQDGNDLDGGSDGTEQQEHHKGDDTALDASVSMTITPYPPCSTYNNGNVKGVMPAGPVEISGVVASREYPDTLWTHDDGDSRYLWAVSYRGVRLGEWTVKTAFPMVDWEDISVVSMVDGADFIVVADVGDNAAREGEGAPRDSIWIALVPEPVIDPNTAPITGEVEAAHSYEFTYPDHPHDSEAVTIDPLTGDLYIFAKEESSPSTVFRAKAPLVSGELEAVATLEMSYLTAADISPSGDELILKDYWEASYFSREASTPLEEVFAQVPVPVTLRKEPIGEALAFTADAAGFYTISEGEEMPLWYYAKTCEP